jgi:hypothetical protein
MVPESVANWMLSPAHLSFAFFCFAAPVLFYCSLCIAGISVPLSKRADIGGSLVALCLVPAAWYIVLVVGFRFLSLVDLPFQLGLAFFIASTAVVIFAFLRLLLWLYRLADGVFLPSLLAGLVLPLGGLALNSVIPFPADLQYPSVYVLTALNGLILLIPFGTSRGAQTAAWFLRCAFYPFSLYFFLLFLPFLPFSILAMIAAGAGFLILAPTFLFVIHTRRLFDEARQLKASHSTLLLTVIFLAALSLMPAGYTARALWHRSQLMQAVDATYSPDYSVSEPGVKPGAVRAALVRLQNMKQGLYLPFLSEYYNQLVFDGMVLPDHKIAEISRLICGEDVTEPDNSRLGRGANPFMFLLGSNVRSQSWRGARRVPDTVSLEAASVTSIETNGALVEARVELAMQNDGTGQAEFRTSLEVSPGMALSGYELKIEGEWADGRIFDRKSAMWIYHMIRDVVRRDPGLLTYTGPDSLKLSVFPFASGQKRYCALDVIYPKNVQASITIGQKEIVLTDSDETAPVVMAPFDDHVGVFIPSQRAGEWPSRRRPRLVHFLLDASASSVDAIPAYPERIEKWLAAHPSVTNTAATAVNYASHTLAPPETPPASLPDLIQEELKKVKPAGGYSPDLAAARNIHALLHAETPVEHATTYVKIGKSKPVANENAASLRALVPDYRIIAENDPLPDIKPVRQFVLNGHRFVLPADKGGWGFAPARPGTQMLEAVNGTETGNNMRLSADYTMRPESRYSSVAKLCYLHRKSLLKPSRINDLKPAILACSRDSGILAHHTAYIVVENSAQWKALERAEKKSLSADQAMEFDEFVTPEPPVWALGAIFFAYLLLRRLRRPCYAHGSRRAT